jgi:glucokinase
MQCALAIDLGGTELRAAVVNRNGQLIACAAEPTDARSGPDAVVAQILSLVHQVRDEAGPCSLLGLGIGSAGPLDPLTGTVIAPPTLHGWHDVPLASVLRQKLAMPVLLENDANAAALGEWRFGAGRGTQSMAFITVSTGIGGGIIADGKLLHGRRGLAAEIGHMTIASDSREACACGARGCWEAMASGTALSRDATRLAASGEARFLKELAGSGPVTGHHVAEAARQGDKAALSLLANEARWLGIGLVNLLHLYSPERLIIGGGVGSLLELMRADIERVIEERAMSAYRGVPVIAAELGRNAGLIGAASMIFNGQHKPELETIH